MYNRVRAHDDCLTMAGVSFHVGSGAHNVQGFKGAVEIARRVVNEVNEKIREDNARER